MTVKLLATRRETNFGYA